MHDELEEKIGVGLFPELVLLQRLLDKIEPKVNKLETHPEERLALTAKKKPLVAYSTMIANQFHRTFRLFVFQLTGLCCLIHETKPFVSRYCKPKYHVSRNPIARQTRSNKSFPEAVR